MWLLERKCLLVWSEKRDSKVELCIGIGCTLVVLAIVELMSGRGRGRTGGRKGKWSNCGRFWMDHSSNQTRAPTSYADGMSYQPQGPPMQPPAMAYQAHGVTNPSPPTMMQQQLPVGMQGGFMLLILSSAQATTMLPLPQYQPIGWGAQPWAPVGQAPPVSIPQPPALQQGNQSQGGDRLSQSGNGKGPAANAFPGPGNRAYFTKEYMDILEGIKCEKAVEDAKKKVAAGRRSGASIRIVDLTDEPRNLVSHPRNQAEQPADKAEEMKAWVTATLGNSLKLISDKLELVDKRSKLADDEKLKLERLREEKARSEKESKEASNSEKRNRRVERTPVEASPLVSRAKPRTRASAKNKSRSKRIDLSNNNSGKADVKQNLQAKVNSNSDLADIKKLLVSLVQEVGDRKGKGPAMKPVTNQHIPTEDSEDIDLAQNGQHIEMDDEEEEADKGGLAACMKLRLEFYTSLQYTRIQELCKQKYIQYFRKELGAWELARIGL
ncbi:hypothetical protein CBR_g28500 [Chara braunii]|uniref:Uncharacterized protein n=1 Tax=Chara braunii TaxID=69332 RepID=A0A388JW26_CHABU|nr:hypothetical protein CBR_g28500 [Chara braunii]|eukprot:GBG62024.1 hypothetical protein CBR_g28500 [Chara braunii]